MLIKNLKECKEFIGKDKTTLREILHPKNDNVHLSCSLAYAKLKPGDFSLPISMMNQKKLGKIV
jgi:hypothetical protein